MAEEFDAKQSYEEYYVAFGFADKLVGSATISSYSVTAIKLLDGSDALATITDSTLATISGTDILIWVKGGTDQSDYLITVKIGSSDGGHYELEGILPIRDLTVGASMLIIEDGTLSSASANSYVTVAFVDTYCRQMGYSAWFALSNEAKETAILRAMVFIDAQKFRGHKTGYDNPLAWPRIGVYGDSPHSFNFPEDYEYWSEVAIDAIPLAVKRATAEAAYLESQSAGTLLTDKTTNIKREKVDILEVEYFSPNPSVSVFSKVLALLKEVLEPSNDSGHVATVLRT